MSSDDATGPLSVDHRELLRKAAVGHPDAVAQIVVALGWSVTSPEELVEYLQRIVDLAVELIHGADSAGVTADLRGTKFTAAHTDETTLDVDNHQYDADDGPCLYAMRERLVVQLDNTSSELRWPEFTVDAEKAGVRSFMASPLGTAEYSVGALNLYSRHHNGFDADDEVLTRVLVGHGARAIGEYTRLSAAQDLAAQLQNAMTGRAPIEQAKGILMAVHGITADEAFAQLRQESQTSNRRLQQVAADFLAENTGVQNTGVQNTGVQNTGVQNTGAQNTGARELS